MDERGREKNRGGGEGGGEGGKEGGGEGGGGGGVRAEERRRLEVGKPNSNVLRGANNPKLRH